jgi:hypothetical protein
MTTLTEGQHAGEFILMEAEGDRSFESVTVLSGQNLVAGQVVGKVKRGIGRASIPAVVSGGSGNGTMSLVTIGKYGKVGNYVVTCTAAVANGGVFSVVNPDGNALPSLTLTVGAGATTAYVSDEINFSITDGSGDFEVGDVFTIAVDTTAPTVIGGTGTGTISLLSMGPEAKTGNYKVDCIVAATNGGTFQVLDPDGNRVGEDFVLNAGSGNATAFTSKQINFTITDATDFIVGNYFDVAVYRATDYVASWTPVPASYDGREDPAGVLYDAVDASSSALPGVLLARDATVTAAELQWGAAITAAEKEVAKTRMAAELHIVSR